MQMHWVTVISSHINFLSYGDVAVPKYSVIGTTGIVWVYETVRCPSVCPIRELCVAAACLLLWAQMGRRY